VKELEIAPVEANNEDAKFEAIMRMESMNIKLGQFDSDFLSIINN
jgi:hypothetical protein